jgi:hypothetical protein
MVDVRNARSKTGSFPKARLSEAAASQGCGTRGLGGSRRIGKTNKRPFGFHTYIKALDVGGRVPSVVQVHRLEAEKADENLKEEKQRKSEWLHRSKLPPSFVS